MFNRWSYRASKRSGLKATLKRVLGEDGHFYRLQVESFADAIRGEDKFPAARLEDGLAAIRVLRAIGLFTEKGEPVTMADVTGAI